MPVLIAAIWGGLATVLGSMVGRVLLALGIGYVTYSGFDVGITWLLNQIKGNFGGMPADIVAFLAWLWVDRAIGLMFSAYSAALAIRMAGATTMTKMVTK